MSAATIQPPELPPIDRVRLIRRSTRCFLFGLAGAIPCFGLGTAWLSFKLYRDIAAETGEPVQLYPLFITSVSGLWVGVGFLTIHWPDVVLGDAIVVLGLEFLFIFRQYRKNAPSEWNPARHLMYWGLGLANAGLILSAVVVILAIYLVTQP
jgi:hypothetical protein